MKKPNGRIAAYVLLAVILLAAVGAQFFSYWRGRVAAPDGEKTYLSQGRVDVNSADVEALSSLPGIGEAIARRIVAWREENGPFESVSDLTRVEGMGRSKLAALEPYICAEPPETHQPDASAVPASLLPPAADNPEPTDTPIPADAPEPTAVKDAPGPTAASIPEETPAPTAKPTPEVTPVPTEIPEPEGAPTQIIVTAQETAPESVPYNTPVPTDSPDQTTPPPADALPPEPVPDPMPAAWDSEEFMDFLNHAPQSELLPVVGDALSVRIIAHRKFVGPYQNALDALSTEGITPDILNQIAEYLQSKD